MQEKLEADSSKQQVLFDGIDEEWWISEWQNMPEFIQKDLMPCRQIIVSFRHSQDVELFSELIEQNITDLTKSVWYPKAEKNTLVGLAYVDDKKEQEF